MANYPRLDEMFSRNEKGEEVTRDRTCECGRPFTQRLLGAKFLEAAERHGRPAIRAVTEQIPELYVPVHCPPCERKDLGRQAALDALKHAPERSRWQST